MEVYRATTRRDDLGTIILADLCFGLQRSNLCLQNLQAAGQAVCFYFHFAFFKPLATVIESHGNNANEFYTPAYSSAKQTIYINFKTNGTTL